MLTPLENIRARAIALRSSIHNEQQYTAVELCGMVAKKTNELIDVVNELCDIVDNVISSNGLIFTYDDQKESLNIGATE